MLNNNHRNSICAFAEPLISYLYDESGAAEKAEFETHLANCSACRNELAEFGAARTAMQEWRTLEFDILPTPAFEIPSPEHQIKMPVADVSPSWFAGWRQIFAFKPALAMSGLIVLIALFGIGLMSVRFQNQNGEIAENSANAGNLKIADDEPMTAKIEESPKQIETVPETVEPEKSNPSVASAPLKSASKKPFSAPISPMTTIKDSTNAARNGAPEIIPSKAAPVTNRADSKSILTANSKVPHLSDTEDEEDNSVRLADLFDEIGTR